MKTISAWSLALPFGIGMLVCGARIIEAGHDTNSVELVTFVYCISYLALAIGLWTGPEVLENGAELPGSRLRALAGTGRAFARPLLAAVLLIVAARSGLALWPEPRSLQVALAGSYLILIASAYLVFGGVPAMYATWRSVGALILRPETATVRPGENLVAVAEMVRPSRNLKAFLLLHDSSSKATDSLANRYQGTVVASSEAEGVWTARVSVQVPGDALPTLEELTDDVESPWRYWQLEVIAEDANGRKTSRLCDISVRANS